MSIRLIRWSTYTRVYTVIQIIWVRHLRQERQKRKVRQLLLTQITTSSITFWIGISVDIQTLIQRCSLHPELEKIVIVKIPNDLSSSGNSKKISDILSAKTVPGKTINEFVEEKFLVFTGQKDDVTAQTCFQNKFLVDIKVRLA